MSAANRLKKFGGIAEMQAYLSRVRRDAEFAAQHGPVRHFKPDANGNLVEVDAPK